MRLFLNIFIGFFFFIVFSGQKLNFLDFYSRLPSLRKRKFFKAKKINTLVEHGTFKYYSTNRSPTFQHDHWKEEIPLNLLLSIQNHSRICQKALKSLNYSYFQIPETDKKK